MIRSLLLNLIIVLSLLPSAHAWNRTFYLSGGTFNVNGATYLGNYTNGNYTAFSDNGTITLHGTARTTESIWIDANGLKAPGEKPATFIQHGLSSAWQFDDAVESNQESICGNMQIPSCMDRSVAPTFSIGWSADGVSPGDCGWQLEYLWTSLDEDTTAAAQDVLVQNSTASATPNGLVLLVFTDMEAPSATDACLHFKITRLSAHDTIADTVELLGVCMGYTLNKLGAGTSP